MKTITSFLLGILFLSLAILMLSFCIHSLTLSANVYTLVGTIQNYDFQITFIITAIVQAVISIGFIQLAVKCFNRFGKYYQNYLTGKRNRELYKQLEEAKYEELYRKLNAQKSPQDKKDLLESFFRDKDVDKIKSIMNDLVGDIKRKTPDHWSKAFDTMKEKDNLIRKNWEEALSSKDNPKINDENSFTVHSVLGFDKEVEGSARNSTSTHSEILDFSKTNEDFVQKL